MAELIRNFKEGQVKESPAVDFVIEGIEHFPFHLNESFFGDLFMYDLFVNGFDFQRVNFIHFGSDVHGCDSNDVQLRNWKTLCISHEKSVH